MPPDVAAIARHAVRHLARPDGELRANVLRLVVVAVFYAVHLVNIMVLGLPPGRTIEVAGLTLGLFDVGATLAAAGWVALASAVLFLENNPRATWIGWLGSALDLGFLTALIALAGGASTSLVLVYPLVVVGSGLRSELRHVVASCVGALLAYALVYGGTWVFATPTTPPMTDALVTAAAIVGAGFITWQLLAAAAWSRERQEAVLAQLWRASGATLPDGAQPAVPRPSTDPTGPECPWCGGAVARLDLRCPACDQPLVPGGAFAGEAGGGEADYHTESLVTALLIGSVFAMVGGWALLSVPAALPPVLAAAGLVGAGLYSVLKVTWSARASESRSKGRVVVQGALRALAVGAGLVGFAIVVSFLTVVAAAVLLFAVCAAMLAGASLR
jgi:hypothetical protein